MLVLDKGLSSSVSLTYSATSCLLIIIFMDSDYHRWVRRDHATFLFGAVIYRAITRLWTAAHCITELCARKGV